MTARRFENFKKQLTKAQQDEILRLSRDGYSISQIIKRCGVAYMTALRYSEDTALDAREERLHYGAYPVAPQYTDFTFARKRLVGAPPGG